MEQASILVSRDSAALAEVAEALRGDGYAVTPFKELDAEAVERSGARAVLFDAASLPVRRLGDLLGALRARRTGRPALVALLASDPEAGAQWLAQGADEFARTPQELLLRLRARLRPAEPALRPSGGGTALSPRAAAELALGEVERALGVEGAHLVVLTPARDGYRVYTRTLGMLVESTALEPEDVALALGQGGLRHWSAGDPTLSNPVRRRLASHQAGALALLRLSHREHPVGAVVAYLAEPPPQGALDALAALEPTLLAALRGAVTLEDAYLGRFRELLEANRRLRELNHAKDELVALCAHDLRSPLNALMAQAQLMAQGVRGELPGPARATTEAILKQAAKMSELIGSLLAERALSTGVLELRKADTDLSALLAEVVEEALPAAQDKGIALLSEGLTGGPTLPVDADRLREALSNLVSNAVKYTPTGGRVEVSLRAVEGGAQLSVKDNGPGIPPEELPHLFRRYARGKSGREAGLGMGLGLAMAKEVVALHGGTIHAQSAVGTGTRFVVWLPGATQAEKPAAPERPRVLIVEDDTDLREVMVELLRERYDVIEAGDGEDGVAQAKALRPDMVLMDLFMPQMDGFSALEDLRRDPRTAELPVIFLSGQSDEAVKCRVLDMGAADYLVKPFSPRELVSRVERVLKQTAASSQLKALSQVDALTGLPNYGAFRTRLMEELKRSSRYRTPLAAVMIDLDHLKTLNDVHGHELGNKAIVALADHIRSQLRTTDFAARFGGDEFVVLLPHTRPEEAAKFAERVRAGLSNLELETAKGPVRLKASFGAAALPSEVVRSAEEALRAADAALYQAKRAGRDRVCVGAEAGPAAQPAGGLAGA